MLDAYISEKQLRKFEQNPGILPFGKWDNKKTRHGQETVKWPRRSATSSDISCFSSPNNKWLPPPPLPTYFMPAQNGWHAVSRCFWSSAHHEIKES